MRNLVYVTILTLVSGQAMAKLHFDKLEFVELEPGPVQAQVPKEAVSLPGPVKTDSYGYNEGGKVKEVANTAKDADKVSEGKDGAGDLGNANGGVSPKKGQPPAYTNVNALCQEPATIIPGNGQNTVRLNGQTMTCTPAAPAQVEAAADLAKYYARGQHRADGQLRQTMGVPQGTSFSSKGFVGCTFNPGVSLARIGVTPKNIGYYQFTNKKIQDDYYSKGLAGTDAGTVIFRPVANGRFCAVAGGPGGGQDAAEKQPAL